MARERMVNIIVREMQIKTAMKYHLTAVRMALKKSTKKKHWQVCGEKGTFLTLLVGM